MNSHSAILVLDDVRPRDYVVAVLDAPCSAAEDKAQQRESVSKLDHGALTASRSVKGTTESPEL